MEELEEGPFWGALARMGGGQGRTEGAGSMTKSTVLRRGSSKRSCGACATVEGLRLPRRSDSNKLVGRRR